MAATEPMARIAPHLGQVLENESAQKSLMEGSRKLRAAYERSQKRRVKASRDKKVRRELSDAGDALGAGLNSLIEGDKKPRWRRRTRRIVAVGLAGAGVALTFAFKDDLGSLLGDVDSLDLDPDGETR